MILCWSTRVESDPKKCRERRSTKQRSVDNVSQQPPTVTGSLDSVSNAAAADAADAGADSNLTLIDSKLDASEPVGELHEPLIGWSLC